MITVEQIVAQWGDRYLSVLTGVIKIKNSTEDSFKSGTCVDFLSHASVSWVGAQDVSGLGRSPVEKKFL